MIIYVLYPPMFLPLGSRLAAFTVAPCSKSFLAFAAQVSTLRRSAPTVKASLVVYHICMATNGLYIP